MKNIGYTIYVNKNWEALAKILIDSLEIYSNYNVELFTINYDSNLKNKNLIKKRIDVSPENRATICYSKLKASYLSDFDFSLIMDADMIPMTNIDELLEKNYELYKDSKYPVCALHPHDPWKNQRRNVEIIKKVLNIDVDITIPYNYGSYFFTKNSKWFFEEAYESSIFLMNKRINPTSFDETVMNILLNKYGVSENVGYNYLPNYFHYDTVLDGTFESDERYLQNYKSYGCLVQPYIFHGCKNHIEAKKISDEIFKYYKKNKN